MPFVLRDEGSTDNPPLAVPYGKQMTAGKLTYYIKESRTKCILILGEGEMDGIDRVFYNGEPLPEFSSAANTSDRNWRFHPGTLTVQPSVFYDVVSISGDTLTLSSNPFTGISTITETLTATGGFRTLSFLGSTTVALPHNATAATIRAALEALPSINPGDVTVGGAYPTLTYTFSASLVQWSAYLMVNTDGLTGGTSTLSRPSEVALVAGVDPTPSPYPAGVAQHKKLYVVNSSGNNIKVALSPGGVAVNWTSSQYLLDNLKVYSANAGFFDPIQGRPEFFPNLNFTFSGIAYLEVNLPAEMSEIEEEPTKFKIYVRGKRLQNYDSTGLLADSTGVAYNPLALPAQTKFFSANNALVAMDIILNYMKVDKTRIDWPSWVAFRNHCDEQITWNSGSTEVLGNPAFTFDDVVSPSLGVITKSTGTSAWDASALTSQSTNSLENIAVGGVLRGTGLLQLEIGLTRSATPPASLHHANRLYSIHVDTSLGGFGRLKVYEGASSTPIYEQLTYMSEGDVFKIEVIGNSVNFYRNGTIFHTDTASFGAGTTRGYAMFYTPGGTLSDFVFYPVTGTSRVTNRFDAHVVFPQEIDSPSALQTIFGRAPSCHWQDVNGKIKFIVGTTYSDITWGQTPTAGQRVLADVLSYDPTTSSYLKAVDPTLTTVQNYALGAETAASSTYSAAYPSSAVVDGSRVTAAGWGNLTGWNSASPTLSVATPEWVTIDWKEIRPINRIDVFSLADAITYGSVSPSDTFTLYGLQDFLVQYWNGTGWATLETFVSNNKVWATSSFPITWMSKIRIYMTKSPDSYGRLVEVEAIGPAVTSSPVSRSNIGENSFMSYKTPPENKANFLRLEIRDLDDTFYTKKYVYNDRSALRDQTGILVDFGIVPLGVASNSLGDRLGEAVMRWNSDLDLFVSLKGMASTYPIAKGDIVRLAHDVPGWTLNNPGEFIVLEETIEPSTETADDKSYLLQAYNSEYYSDNDHGVISPNIPTVASPLSPPPAPSALELAEETRTLPDGTSYSAIVGRVTFDNAYPYSQRARVYWKKSLDVDFIPTNIVLEQPHTGFSQIPFELNFAPVGENEVKVVTENLNGVTSLGSIIEGVDITGGVQIEPILWEGLVNTQMFGANLTKIAGGAAWNAGARSTKALSYTDGYFQVILGAETVNFSLGFTNYNYNDNSNIMDYSIIVGTGVLPKVQFSGVDQTVNGNAVIAASGQSFKMEIVQGVLNVYQVVDNVPLLIFTSAVTPKYPLYVDASIFDMSAIIPPVQVYGNLEQTTGARVHWQSVRNVDIDLVGTEEVITKLPAAGAGWATVNSAGTYSAERLPRNGAVEWLATETDKYRAIGLSQVDAEIADPDAIGLNGIQYAWYMAAGGVLQVTEFGVSKFVTSYVTGDILRIARTDGVVRYRKNGVLLYTSVAETTEPLYIDTAFYDINSTIKDVRLKRVGAFTPSIYSYPIYLVEDIKARENKPHEDGSTYHELEGIFSQVEESPILRAKVKVFNKFGDLVSDYPPFTFAGNGMISQGFHDRKYADPYEEAIYEVRMDNGFSLSPPLFIKGNADYPPTFSESFVMPALLNASNAVQDLICSPIDHNKISLNWTYVGGVDIQYRLEPGTAWTSLVVNQTTKPYSAINLVANTYYEFRACPTGTGINWSNICSTRTLQAPLPAETFPPPLSLVASLTAASPSTSVDLSWNRNSTNNTGVKIYQDGVLIYTGSTPTEITKTISGLTASTTYTFKVKNIYAGGDSIDSNVVTITTGAVTSSQKPSGLSATSTSPYSIRLNWTNNTSAGNVLIERSFNGTSFTQVATVAATSATYTHLGLIPDTQYWYRVKNSTVEGYSNIAFTATFPEPDTCILPDTLIWIISEGRMVQEQAKYLKIGDEVITILKGGEISSTKLKSIMWGKSDTINFFTTKSGKVLGCTPSHPLITDRQLAVEKATTLRSGELLLVVNDTVDKVYQDVIESKETLKGRFNVIIFELEDADHTFISGGVVSHNIVQK
jgi:hypothetical protein